MKFAKEDRVSIPGEAWKGVQAVILDATETVYGFPIYTIGWLDGGGSPVTGTIGETDLLSINVPKPIVTSARPRSASKRKR